MGVFGESMMEEMQLGQPETCNWYQDDEAWKTTCKNAFVFNDDGPSANGFAFCPYCGMPLNEKPQNNRI